MIRFFGIAVFILILAATGFRTVMENFFPAADGEVTEVEQIEFSMARSKAYELVDEVEIPEFVLEVVQDSGGLYMTVSKREDFSKIWKFEQDGHLLLIVEATIADASNGNFNLVVKSELPSDARDHATGNFGDSLEAYGKTTALLLRRQMSAALAGEPYSPEMKEKAEAMAQFAIVAGTPGDRQARLRQQ